jgi:arginyl-tRNA--protein-N-Asp/Glu arginylyltransferase
LDVFDTHCVRIYDENKLIAMGLFDKGKVSIASILNFFDPHYSKYSLGKYIILLIIEKMKEWGMFCYFPGYIVAGKPKFDYKLFLGEEAAKYMNKELSWIIFDRSILIPEKSTFNKFVDFVQFVSNAEDRTLSDEIN